MIRKLAGGEWPVTKGMGSGRFRRGAIAALAGCVLGLGVSVAAEVVDQAQDASESAEGLAVGRGQDLGQTVTAGVSGILSAVRLPLTCSSGTVQLEIQGVDEGLPDGRVLAADSLTIAPGSLSTSPLTIPVTGLPPFRAGDSFAVLVSASGECVLPQGPSGDSYAGGQGLVRRAGSQVWEPLAGARDLPFETLVFPRAEDTVVVGVNLDGDQPKDKEEGPQGGYAAVRCFIQALQH
jgi:hypothetical protein